ncbi:MAG: hypothetical protein WCK96_19250 [Methylococcales bacterium]
MEKSKDNKSQALVKQQTERARILKILLQPKPIEELTPQRQKEVLMVRAAFEKVPPPTITIKKTYRNEYDQNAHGIIQLAMLLTQEQFAQLPDVDSETVYFIIKRMVEVEQYNFEWKLKAEQQKASNAHLAKAEDRWQPYREKFNEYIRQGKEEKDAKRKIGNEIQRLNQELVKQGKKPLCNGEEDKKTGQYNYRPDRSTLGRQLMEKNPLYWQLVPKKK